MLPNERLRVWRCGEGLSLAQAGEKVGVSAPTFHDYEKGKKRPGRGARRDLVEAVTGIPADDWATPEERALDARARAAQSDADRPPTSPPRAKKASAKRSRAPRPGPVKARTKRAPKAQATGTRAVG